MSHVSNDTDLIVLGRYYYSKHALCALVFPILIVFFSTCRHVSRRGQTVPAAVPLRHGAAVRRRTDQLAGPGRGLRRARALCGRGLHRSRRAVNLRRHVLLASVSRASAKQRTRFA